MGLIKIMMVKCKICGNKIDRDIAYKVSKTNEETKKITNSYYCSEGEYNKDKENKGLWREVLLLYDFILGFTSISKVKVNQIKEMEEVFTRREIYECLKYNADNIKLNMENKFISDEYNMICYITASVKNKIKDFSNCGSGNMITNCSEEDIINMKHEEDEDILNRLKRQRNNAKNNSVNIFDIIENGKKGE